MLPIIERILSQPQHKGLRPLSELMDCISRNLEAQINTLVFKYFPGLQDNYEHVIPSWPDEIYKKFK